MRGDRLGKPGKCGKVAPVSKNLATTGKEYEMRIGRLEIRWLPRADTRPQTPQVGEVWISKREDYIPLKIVIVHVRRAGRDVGYRFHDIPEGIVWSSESEWITRMYRRVEQESGAPNA